MRIVICLLGLSLVLAGCDQSSGPKQASAPAGTEAPWAEARKTLEAQLAEQASQRSRRLSVSATGFSDAVNGLLEDPVPARLNTARQAWEHLYQSFNEAYVVLACRASGHAADAERLERSDNFPILPGYIDGLSQWPDSGIVNDVALPLSRDSLLEQQAATQEGEASIGFQVIHFLLFGEPDAPRTAEAFSAIAEVPADPSVSVEDQPGNRRRAYLRLAAALLVEDLALLSRGEQLSVPVGAGCPVGALRETVARLIRLENLQDATQTSQEYLAAKAHRVATAGLQQALAPWLAKNSALREWLALRLADTQAKLESLPAPGASGRIKALQALHAELIALERALRPPPR